MCEWGTRSHWIYAVYQQQCATANIYVIWVTHMLHMTCAKREHCLLFNGRATIRSGDSLCNVSFKIMETICVCNCLSMPRYIGHPCIHSIAQCGVHSACSHAHMNMQKSIGATQAGSSMPPVHTRKSTNCCSAEGCGTMHAGCATCGFFLDHTVSKQNADCSAGARLNVVTCR